MNLLLNGKPVEIITYPNNETLLRPDMSDVKADATQVITLRFESDADIFHLRVLSEYIRDYFQDEFKIYFVHMQLILPYMPYSRADRSENGSIFTLKYVCQMFNAMGFREIIIVEPHSSVTKEKLFTAGKIINGAELLLPLVKKDVNFDETIDYLIFPDAGASERYASLSPHNLSLSAAKTRDFNTGKITDIKFNRIIDGTDRRAIIVDDLCSKGGTFIATANLLRNMGFSHVYLMVTHLEKAAYNKALTSSLDGIYATDSMMPPEPNSNMTIYKLKDLLSNV